MGAKKDFVQTLKLEGLQADGFEINEQNFIAAFSILMIQLQLTDERPKKKSILPQLNKVHAYSFKIDEAVVLMKKLNLKIESGIIDNIISFSFGPDFALSLLKKFFNGHLLHDPSSRTETNLLVSSTVQITPKGTAVLYGFCKSVGMRRRDMPQVVRSSFNTMKIFQFDRSSTTRRALYSKYLNHILMSEMLGPSPNVWSPDAKPKQLSSLFSLEESDFLLESDYILFSGAASPSSSSAQEIRKSISPFHHRYFSNPESDAHIQYFESSSGMRLMRDKIFHDGSKEIIVDYCFSGKAFVQWLCDCSTLYCINEAVEFGQLMLHFELIVPVTQCKVNDKFKNHRDAFYTWNEAEEHVCRWSPKSQALRNLRKASAQGDVILQVTNDNKTVFRKLLADPGIRHLFMSHLEKEKCAENMNAFLQLKEFQDVKKKLSSLVKHYNKSSSQSEERLLVAAEKMATKSLSMASYLCSRYFSPDSACHLNIDFGLQQEMIRVIAMIRDGNICETPLSDGDFAAYLKTPIIKEEMTFDLNPETAKASKIEETNEETSITSSEMGELSQIHSSLMETVGIINKIDRVFRKIALSVYRMMEVDSYPKFIQSEEYILAVETLTHRS